MKAQSLFDTLYMNGFIWNIAKVHIHIKLHHYYNY